MSKNVYTYNMYSHSTPLKADFSYELITLFFPDHKAIPQFEKLKKQASAKEQLDLGRPISLLRFLTS